MEEGEEREEGRGAVGVESGGKGADAGARARATRGAERRKLPGVAAWAPVPALA